jgi:protein-S-isoprenylcysteine O-methyltransferase Ste14
MDLSLTARAFSGLAFLLGAVALLLFASAWTLDWWQAWVFLALFAAAVIAITVYFLRADPELIERRLKAGPGGEHEATQRLIQSIASAVFIVLIVVPGFDYRFGWSHLPLAAVVVGDVLVVAGLAIVFRVFQENSYTSAIIEVGTNQPVISTGPYRLIRHPMYAGALVMVFGIPLALGSAWGLAVGLPMTGLLVARLLDEERFLSARLPGYRDYCRKTAWRLVPGIW